MVGTTGDTRQTLELYAELVGDPSETSAASWNTPLVGSVNLGAIKWGGGKVAGVLLFAGTHSPTTAATVEGFLRGLHP